MKSKGGFSGRPAWQLDLLAWLDRLASRLRDLTAEARWRKLILDGVVTVGRHTYGAPRVHYWHNQQTGKRLGGRVVIGSFCSIGEDVHILTGGNHRPEWVTTFPLRIKLGLPEQWADGLPASRGDVVIGHDVWIGRDSTILSGVTIGTGAVIGARALVSHDVEPYSIVAGNPAQPIRKRFSPERIERLLRNEWWNWPEEQILQFVPLLSSEDIDAFLDKAEAEGPTVTSPAGPACYACGGPVHGKKVGVTPMLVCSLCGMGHVPREAAPPDYWNRREGSEELSESHWEARRELFEVALARIEGGQPPGRTVDVGGGVGYFAEAALKRGWDAYSVDTSPLAQAAASERVGAERSLSAADAGKFRGTCDLVTLWCVVAHVPDPSELLEQAVDLLKPGGKLMLTTPNFLFQAPYARALNRLRRPLDFVAHDHYLHFTPAALDRLLRKAGFQSWEYGYFGVTEDCVADKRLSSLLVPAKKVWNRVAVHTTAAGLPPMCAELQVLAVKP